MDGTESTLVLHPQGQSALVFNLRGTLNDVVAYTFIVDLGGLDLNEDTRWQWAYEQESGRVIGTTPALVPLRFSVVIKATSPANRQTAYRVLQQAVMNRRGGTLEYLPEGAGTLSTFYHYVASAPPRLVDETRNRWDAAPVNGWYTLRVDVELQTHLLATSDPDSLAEIANATLDNWYDTNVGQSNRLTVAADDLLGSFPALTRFFIAPASGQRLGRVTMFTRSAADGALNDLVTVYEAQDADVILPSMAWAEVVDSERGGEAYMQCLPNSDANNIAHGLRFIFQNPEAAHGRFAVFGVVYDAHEIPGVWTHQVKLVSGNIAQEGESDYYAASTNVWRLMFAGEFELPLTNLSDVTEDYAAGPYLEWYSTRASGTSEFRLDGLLLVWVSDALGVEGAGTALDVLCEDGDVGYIQGGVVAPDRLLIENMLGLAGRVVERAYVVDSDDYLKRVLTVAPKGDFVALEPGYDHELLVVQERAAASVFTDDFAQYKSYALIVLSRLEGDDTVVEPWGPAVYTTDCVEGSRALLLDPTTSSFYDYVFFSVSLDLSIDGRFGSDDYIIVGVYVPDPNNVDGAFLYLATDYPSNVYYIKLPGNTMKAGWNQLYAKRSAFTKIGSPSWADINVMGFGIVKDDLVPNRQAIFDYLRTEKAHPSNANIPNATGGVWDFEPDTGVWTITEDVEEDDPGATLACLDNDTGGSEFDPYNLKKAQLSLYEGDNVRFSARISTYGLTALHPREVGIFWRGDATLMLTSGNEQGYGALINTRNGTLKVYRYTSGESTELYAYSSAFLSEDYHNFAHKWYTLGVQVIGASHRLYCSLSSGLNYDDSTVFTPAYLRATVTDATYNSGKIGVLCRGTLGRFDDVVVESLEDKHVPADQITLTGQALFRTIAPFS